MEKLSDYDFEIIFKLLDKRDLNSARKVCKRWSTIIGNSSKLAKSFCLIIDCKNPCNLQQIKDESEKFSYRNFVLKNLHQTKVAEFGCVAGIFCHHKDHMEKLIVSACPINLVNLLTKTEANLNLTHLTIESFMNFSQSRDQKIDLPNLKFLKIVSASEFLDCIGIHRIETLEISDNVRAVGCWHDFFQTCSNLKSLSFEKSFGFDLLPYGFKLEKFELLFLDKIISSDLEMFLRSQKNSLKTLKMRIRGKDFFSFVIDELELETFHCLNNVTESVESQRDNRSIKNLKIFMNTIDFQVARNYRKLLQNLRAVENLEITMTSVTDIFILNSIADSMPNLKDLKIQSVPNFLGRLQIGQQLGFPSKPLEQVENLTVECFLEDEKKMTLLTCCPNVKRLKISSMEITKNELEFLICSLQNLEEILFVKNLEINDKIVMLFLMSKIKKISIVVDDEIEYQQKCDASLKKLKQSKIYFVIQEFKDFKAKNDESE